jgi:hypothetical protein
MRNLKYFITFLACVTLVITTFSQSYKPGDKTAALINSEWKDVTVLKQVTANPVVYEVQAITATGKNTSVIATYQVNEENMRMVNKSGAAISVLGKYNIYSGVQHIYIGRFELFEGGNYKVALSSDEDSYATGTYAYDAATNTIEWKTGFFWQKKWEGKIIGKSRIQFSKGTYADPE